MNNIITIIAGLAMFLFLITIHELGHFLGAKFSGIKVNEFSIGMGPKLFSKQGQETLYSLRALPIGGYVMMEGEESDSEDSRSYNNSKAWKRFLTIFAGPFVNFVFAIIVFFIIANSNGVPTTTISEISPGYPAQVSGLVEGDRIFKVDNVQVNSYQQLLNQIQLGDQNIEVEFIRDGKNELTKVELREEDGRKVIGIKPLYNKSFIESFKYSISMTFSIVSMIWESLRGLVSGALGLDQLSGPVGVVKQVGESLNFGLQGFFMFAAMISVNLGFFNLLPIPALDGSKILFNLFEMITGKKVNRKLEERITIVGFVFLLSLIILVSIKDIITLFN